MENRLLLVKRKPVGKNMNHLKQILVAAAALLVLTASGCGKKDKDRIPDGGYEISKPSSAVSSEESVVSETPASNTESSQYSVKKPAKASSSSKTSGSSSVTTSSGSSKLEITVPDAWYDGGSSDSGSGSGSEKDNHFSSGSSVSESSRADTSSPDKKDDSPSDSSKTDSKPQKNESILSSLPSGFVKKK